MTILYNCKHSGDQYRITKFNDGEPESSYLCTTSECECPAGVRPMCRHREMLPKFIHRGAVNVNWWYDYDRGGWVDMRDQNELDESAKRHDGEEWLKENGYPTQHSLVVEQRAHNPQVDGSIPSAATIYENKTTRTEADLQNKREVVSYRKPNDGRRV